MSVAPFPPEVRLPLGGMTTSGGQSPGIPGDGVSEPRPRRSVAAAAGVKKLI
jgi:hypothetical protein